jgi:hypothetical protein
MVISIVNHTNGQVSDEVLQGVIRAINKQISDDFEPYWSMSAILRLEGRSADQPDQVEMADLRGDAIIYMWDKSDIEDALGYHFQNAKGIPYGFVFTDIAQSIGEPWSVTLSHEALELLGDPETNLLVVGPHPAQDQNREVFHWFEMCDAVQAESYDIDGVLVSNFVLPLYFTGTRDVDEVGARNDFLGREHGGQTLRSFGINPGGYVGFFDPQTGEHDTYALRGDPIARMRLAAKSRAKETRRAIRYRDFAQRQAIRHVAPRASRKRKPAVRQPAVESIADEMTKTTSTAPPRTASVSAAPRSVGRRRSSRKAR